MTTKSGPCVDCGAEITKYVRPGKQLRCLQCAIARAGDNNRTMASRRGEGFEKSARAGHEVGEQIRNREGPLYDKWRAGMANFLGQTTR